MPLPDGLMMMVPTKILPLVGTRLLSWGTKIRMGLEFLRRPPKAPLADRSVYDFLLDHYGQESIDYLAEPLLAGVYGGDPREMSVNSVLGALRRNRNQIWQLDARCFGRAASQGLGIRIALPHA